MPTLKTKENFKEPGHIWKHVVGVAGGRGGDAMDVIERLSIGNRGRDQVTCDVRTPGIYEIEQISYAGMRRRREVATVYRVVQWHRGELIALRLVGDHVTGEISIDKIHRLMLGGASPEDFIEIVEIDGGAKWRVKGGVAVI